MAPLKPGVGFYGRDKNPHPDNPNVTSLTGTPAGQTGGPMVRRFTGNGGNGPNPGGGGILSAYLPGQLAGIAGPLSQSFGGTEKQWSGILGQPYSDMQMPKPFDYSPAKKKPDDVKHDGKPDPVKGDDPDPFGHDRAVMAAFQSMAPQQGPMPMQEAQPQNMAGQMAAQPMQQPNAMFQQPQQQVLSPQVIAMLRQQFGGR